MSRAELHNDRPLTFVISPSQLLQKSVCYCLLGYLSKLLWEEREKKGNAVQLLIPAAIQRSSSVNEPMSCLLQHSPGAES